MVRRLAYFLQPMCHREPSKTYRVQSSAPRCLEMQHTGAYHNDM